LPSASTNLNEGAVKGYNFQTDYTAYVMIVASSQWGTITNYANNNVITASHIIPTKSIGQRINTSLAVQFYCFLTSNPRTTNTTCPYLTVGNDGKLSFTTTGKGYNFQTDYTAYVKTQLGHLPDYHLST